jgi:hypothetical protein
VAEAILHCAEYPERDVPIGGASRAMSAAALSPRLMDWYQELTSFRQQRRDRPVEHDPEGSLHRPSHDLSERADYPDRHIRETSLDTSA